MCLLLTYIHSYCTHIQRIGTYTCYAATLRARLSWTAYRELNEHGEVRGFDRLCERYVEVEQDVACGYSPTGEGNIGATGWCWECRVEGKEKLASEKRRGKIALAREGDSGDGQGEGAVQEECGDRYGVMRAEEVESDSSEDEGSEGCEMEREAEELMLGYTPVFDGAYPTSDIVDFYDRSKSLSGTKSEIEELDTLLGSPASGFNRDRTAGGNCAVEDGYETLRDRDWEKDVEGAKKKGGGITWEKGRDECGKESGKSKGRGLLWKGKRALGADGGA